MKAWETRNMISSPLSYLFLLVTFNRPHAFSQPVSSHDGLPYHYHIGSVFSCSIKALVSNQITVTPAASGRFSNLLSLLRKIIL